MVPARNKPEPVAIIGSSCRFPGGSNSPAKLWNLLKTPIDLLTDIPLSRFNPAGFYHENAEHPGTTDVTKAYLLDEDPWAFDNEFFNISSKEASSMDPQQRVILETVYECIESAGYSISQLKGSATGVFVGQMSDDYAQLILRDMDCHPQHSGTGVARSILANRISYAFDWKGPSINMDTACSSSLVALHLAVQSVRSGESDMAIVAGVNLVFSPELFSFLSSLRMLSPDGRSRMWDANANGYARGEGFAAILIKSLGNASADGDDVETIIRNTGINQDGRSAGLTVPSTTAQAELIKSTYTRCGLDYQKEEDRCQFFEAHGTGTPAGDPKEAEAISSTFFPDYGHASSDTRARQGLQSEKIHVGSIKTVIGHLEGTAGLGSLLKASLAVQHGLIPPNLHFGRLNPVIEPFYDHLEVPTTLKPWPKLPAGAPRRASVNSFGFGGTNAHAIIESWEEEDTARSSSSSPSWGPFVVSAYSEKALTAMVVSLSAALKDQTEIDLCSLAWTLQARRTHFTYRASFSATSKEELIARLDSAVQDNGELPVATKSMKVSSVHILGVFTGQGAQWSSMGASLFRHSASFRQTIEQLESALQEIPNGPTWSLTEELLRQDELRRISSAEISQTLCTALQVALVNLLMECGISFSAVVGHSSGEIAAAYAAGVLTAVDAVVIAFYRGYHSRLANLESGTSGKMMAVGMTPHDADILCRQERFLGKICVAAENSPSSVTISGDASTILEAKAFLDEEAVFARILQVDTAYHSHHMERVRGPYLDSLKQANIRPRRICFEGPCNWYSSVYGPESRPGSMTSPSSFEHTYWVENMTNPVLFSHAIASALQHEHFDLALEIGPHPALRGPATESMQTVSGTSIPYRGVLERNKNCLEVFSGALGFVWTNIDSPAVPVDFTGFQRACKGPDWAMPRVHKGLPTYPWDHDRPMLQESKNSKAWRTRNTPFDELLGYPSSNSSRKNHEVRWRNVLRVNDVDWLQGHQFQNQVLLPAAAYLAMAMNATLHLVGYEQQIQLVEMQDIVIHNAITLEEDSLGVDINFVIRLIHQTSDTTGDFKTAEFSCRCSNVDAASPEFDMQVFTGRVLVKLGDPVLNVNVLPNRVAPSLPMTDVATDRFYSWMQKLGLEYSGPFVVESIKRRLNVATITTTRTVNDRYKIHPGTMDSILHSIYNAFAYPGDGRLWTTYLPKSFGRIRFDMNGCQHTHECAKSRLLADCYLTEASARRICGDINVFCAEDGHPEIQAQGILVSSLETPSAANDQSMFWETIWKREFSSAMETIEGSCPQTALVRDRTLHETCERTAYFYLRQLCREITPQEIMSMEWHYQCFLNWCLNYVLPDAHASQNSCWRDHWDLDTIESIKALKTKYYGQIDLELIHDLGSALPSILRDSKLDVQMFEGKGRFEALYTEGLGIAETNGHLGLLLDHLTHKYPQMRVLEIGAGTGGSTSVALQAMGSNLEDYTFSDRSPSLFPAAQVRFTKHKKIMNFQILDIGRSPLEQDFQEHTYDLVIAAHLLHGTKSISQTVQHCRQLLRPGGYLVLLELVNPKVLRVPFLFSSSPRWWLGGDDGQHQSPTLTETQWDVVLRENLFSGVDSALRDFTDDCMHTFSVIVSQAVDSRVSVLRDPLGLASGIVHMEKLLVIGGQSLPVSKIAFQVQHLLSPFAKHITIINDLNDIPESGNMLYGSAVICLSGLEEATFARIDPRRFSVMQSLFRQAKHILWVTRGCRADDPYANIVVGIARSASREMEHLRLRVVDIDHVRLQKQQPEAIMFSEMLLQMMCLDLPSYDDILWSHETEVVVENGVVLIPRVVPNDDINKRFNSTRRMITKSVSPIPNSAQLLVENHSVFFGKKESDSTEEIQASPCRLQVLSSSLFQFTCSDSHQPFYICLGYGGPENTNQFMLAISETNSLAITVAPDHIFSCGRDTSADEVLSTILTIIICESLLSNSTGTIWVHDADDFTAGIICLVASHKAVSVFLTTSNATSLLLSDGTATYIHPRATERERKSLIPRDIRRFVDMRVESDSLGEFTTVLAGHEVEIQQGLHHATVEKAIPLLYSTCTLMKIIEANCSRPDLLDNLGRHTPNTVIKADMVNEQLESAMATSVISWTNVQSIRLRVVPATSERLFADQKTYFLIGLTGNVGLSLCEWMIDHGARYFAIASRSPAVPPEMCKHLENMGATIRIFSLDVAEFENVRSVHEEIASSMPPIAGVANAALVVRDHPFDGTSFDDLQSVFKPKVIGTQNLDNLFFSTSLDFFILFSSIAAATGNPGQSSYCAANLFMSTVAMRRRKRGLAASVMHFPMLLGFGFLHEQATGDYVESRFRQEGSFAIPEPDFHATFAQAILSGRPDSGLNPELISGLGTDIDTPWRAIPRLSHCYVKDEKRKYHNRDRSTRSLQDLLKAACDSQQAFSILKAAIASRVSLALGSQSEDVDKHVGLISLGLDSLGAVGIRSWILKVLEVDVPVLKFLGGSSLEDICHNVLSKLPSSLKTWDEGRDKPYKQPNGATFDPKHDLHSQTPHAGPTSDHTDNRTVTSRPDITNGTTFKSTNGETKRGLLGETAYERIGDMSHAQAQLYFLHEYLQTNAYNIAYSGYFHGQLDLNVLQEALRAVGRRHEALRSAYFMDMSSSRAVQAVFTEPRIILEHKPTCNEIQLRTEMEDVKNYRFEIEKGVVMKVTVMSQSPSLHAILFSHHHIALDGISWSIFIADLSKAYSGRLSRMSESPRIQQSIDMAERQLKALTPRIFHADLAFWKDIYKTIPEPIPLFPFAKFKTRPNAQDYNVNHSGLRLPRYLTKLMERAASQIGVTSFHFYLASLATFLARCLGIRDVAIGVVDAHRTEAEDMTTIGYFLNMLPIRLQLEQSETFEEVARRSRDAASTAMAHSQTPMDMILGGDGLGISRSTSHHPLFQVAINYRKAPLDETDFGNSDKIQWDDAVPGGNPYDLFLNVAATSDVTFVSLITQRSLYEASDGVLLLKWYTRALEGLARDICTEVGQCPISNKTDIMEVKELGRGSEIKVSWIHNGTLTDRIDEIVALLPNEFAIKDEQSHSLTYAEMAARMMQITHQLEAISPKLPTGSYVAMLLDPTADAVCCILAILRLGFVWIPLDTRNHPRRLRAVVEECRPKVLVCHDSTTELAQRVVAGMNFTSILSIDDEEDYRDNNKPKIPAQEDNNNNRSSLPAMILYTSGSTGVPKGIILTHGALVNQIYGTITTLGLRREVTLQHSPLGFDLMLDQIFLALCNGGTTVMVGKGSRGDPTRLASLMVSHGVTLTHFVPSEYSALLNYGHHILAKSQSWRYAMSGGEKLERKLIKAFQKLDCDALNLVNVYGPAEITLACARGIVPFRELSDLHYGSSDYLRPSPNYTLEIVDDGMNVLPVGFPGEICISGQSVSLGYLNRPEESHHKFLEKETTRSPSPIVRVYRSGDKGRILPDGTLEVMGRLDGDSQVKIHGIRVELDEIANSIVHNSNGAIVNAAVSIRLVQPSSILVAFVVFDVDFTGDKSDFVECLRSDLPLPTIMKPTYIIPMDGLPATANGKIDRVAVDKLPIIKPSVTTGTPVDKLTHGERLIKEVWEEVLSTGTFHVSSQVVIQSSTDFFQLGNSSILMIKLKSLLEVQLGVRVSLPELFQASTLGSMAALVANTSSAIERGTFANSPFLGSRDDPIMINWDLEIATLLDGLPQPNPILSQSSQSLSNGNERLVVILTGATGFIGKHLLSQLVQDPRVAQVHCIAIRPEVSGKPRHVSTKSRKIIEYPGDLWSLNLGLSDAQFGFLAKHANVIIHNGADVSLLKTYQSLRRANVVSTRTLCQLAIPRRVPLHFVSTASVAKAIPHNDKNPLLEIPASAAVPDLLNSIDGYASSKWASETLLEKVAAENGLPAYVHRLAHVVGDDASELDAVGMLTKYSLLLHALPRIERDDVSGSWDFIMVEDVARAMIESAIESAIDSIKQTQQNTSPRFINHCSEVKIDHDDLRNYLEAVAGGPLREIEMKEWLAAACEKGLHPLVYEFFAAFHESHGTIVLPNIAKYV